VNSFIISQIGQGHRYFYCIGKRRRGGRATID